MRKLIDFVLVAGFVFVDLIMFHDLFKAGEQYTLVEYLVGVLSVLVIANALWSLLGGRESRGLRAL